MKIKAKGHIYLVVSLFTGAFLPVVLDFATGMNIFEFLTLAFLVATPASYVLMISAHKKDRLVSYFKSGKNLLIIVFFGILLYVPSSFILLYSEHFVSASLATVVYRIWPLLMLPFLPIILKERLSKYQIAALFLAFIGVYIAITGGTFTLSLSSADIPVVLFLILGAFGYALGSVLMKRYSFNLESAIFVFNLSLLAIFAGLFVITGSMFSPVNSTDIFAVLYLGIIVNIVGFYGYFAAIRILKTTFTTNLYFLSPFITLLTASIVLNEVIKVYYVAIAALVATGLVIQKFDKHGGTYIKSTKERGPLIFDITAAFVSEERPEIHRVIESGGRVLAIKLQSRYRNLIKSEIENDNYKRVSIELGEFGKEVNDFIEEIMGKTENEIIAISVGLPGEGERALNQLYAQIKRYE